MTIRYDFETLERYVRQALVAQYGSTNDQDGGINRYLTNPQKQRYYRIRKFGYATSLTADRMACALKVLPGGIWPSWYDDAETEPRCSWCGVELSWEAKRDACSARCWGLISVERASDASLLADWWERVNAVNARVATMTSSEFDAFLGIDHEYFESVAA